MIKQLRVWLLVAAIGLFALPAAQATHLIGGAMTYEYLGSPGTGGNGLPLHQYRITFKTYLDCTSPFWGTAFPESQVSVGIYQGASNTTNNLPLFDSLTCNLVDTTSISPSFPPGCTVGINVCIYEATYEGTITLPTTFSGYHLFYDRCCRNSGTVNLSNPGEQGLGFTAWIGPNLVPNSSPQFTNPPSPFICTNDTTSILNTAIDAEGDLLIFSFTAPYRGNTGNGQGGNPPPDLGVQNPMINPINEVTWNTGYGTNALFGANGYQYINAFTGYSEYMSPTAGNYVVAVEVQEYRNGNLIGITRRDIQLLVANCPPNSEPELISFTEEEPVITVEEGDDICFPITYFDSNGDSVNWQITGPVFDASLVNPPATLSPVVSGSNTITTNFCWNTVCGQAQPLDYLFNVSVIDNGCPPKITNTVFRIHVNEFIGPTAISGQQQVCSGLQGIVYTVDTVPDAVYIWTVTGGTIVGGDSTNQISVDWGNGPLGSVQCNAISQFGCASQPVQLPITFTTVFADPGNDTTLCSGGAAVLGGSPTAFPGNTVVWSPAAGLDDATALNPTATPDSTTTYVLTVSDGSGCFSIDSVTVNAPTVVMEAGPGGGVCIGDSIQITASGAASYNWTPGATVTDSASATPHAFPSVPTTYVVELTDQFGCVETDSVFVDAWAILPVDAGMDTTYCDGASYMLGGNPTTPAFASFVWSPNTDLDDETVANPLANPSATTVYSVLATDTNGCSNTSTVTVFVNPLPAASAGGDAAFCVGDSAQLTATGGVTYAWGPTGSLTDPNIANPQAFPAITTTYTVTVTDANGCTETDDVMITVNQLPVANAGNNAEICLGDSIQLNGNGGGNYAWTPNINIDNATAEDPTVWPSMTTTYTLVVTDINSCVDEDSVTITVNTLPVADAGNDTTICFADTISVGGSPTGPTGSAYTWTSVGFIGNSSVANPGVSPASSAFYYVEVTDTNGCVSNDSLFITVNVLPAVDAGLDTAICIGDSVQLAGSGAGTPAWMPVGTLSDPSIFNPIAFPTDTTDYLLTVTDGNGCNSTDTMTLIINPLPIAIVDETIELCIGDTLQLQASGGNNYAWSPNTNLSATNIADPLAWPSDTIEYFVNVTDTNGCANFDSVTVEVNQLPFANAGMDATICFGDSIQVGGAPTGPPGATYCWIPTFSVDDMFASNPNAFPSANQEYIVIVFDTNNCEARDSVTINVNVLPVVDAGPDTTVCIGDSTQFMGSGGGTPVWSGPSLSATNIFNPFAQPTDTSDYILTVTDGNLCSNSDTLTVIVHLLPPAEAGPTLEVCTGDSVQLNATGGVVYAWTPATGLSATNIANPLSAPPDTTEYFVTVTDTNGCVNIDSVIVELNQLPIVDPGMDQTICFGDTIQIGGLPTGPLGSTYQWSPLALTVDETLANPSVFPGVTTTFVVAVTDTNTCVSSDSMVVNVNTLPAVDAGPDTTLCIGDTTQLTGSGGGFPSWAPAGSLSNISVFNPLAFPTDTTDYILTITDGNFCQNRDTVNVIVHLLPPADAGINVEVCIFDSVQLNASGGVIYSWSPATWLNDPTAAMPLASPPDTTEYIVQVTDTNGCIAFDSTIVTVNPLPIVSAGPDLAICIFDSTAIGGAPTGPVMSTYAWTPAATLVDSALANPVAFPQMTQQYNVVVTDSNACVNTDSMMLTVNPLPNISAGIDTAICIGDTIQLNATGGTSYAWSPAAGLSATNVADPFASPTDTTDYIVTGTDANTCVNIDTMTLIVYQLPIVDAGTMEWLCPGDDYTLNATGGIGFSWSPGAVLNDSTLQSPVATLDDTTTFVVAVTDTNTCVNVDSVTIIVNAIVPTEAGADRVICFGDSVVIGGSPTSPPGTDFFWSPVVGLNDSTLSNPTASPPVNQMYYVATLNDTCTGMDSMMVTVNALPPADAGIDQEICIGDTAQLMATGGIGYQWTPPNDLSNDLIANPAAFPTTTTEFVVLVTDGNGCQDLDSMTLVVHSLPQPDAGPDTTICFGDTVQIGGAPTFAGTATYSWTPAGAISSTAVGNPFAYPGTTTAYIVEVTDSNTCVNTDTMIVNVNQLPNVDAGADAGICIGDDTQLQATGATSYLWTPATGLNFTFVADPIASPTDTTEYFVLGIDDNGCRNTDSVTVIVWQLPNVSAGNDAEFCIGDSVQLNATGAATYSWTPATDLSSTNIADPWASPTNTITYTVIGTDTNACVNSDDVLVIVNQLPFVDAGMDVNSCTNDPITLGGEPTGPAGSTYQWSPAATLNNAQAANPVATPGSSTTYTVFVLDVNGCVNSDSVTASVFEVAPLQDFTACDRDSVQLGVQTIAGVPPFTYGWTPTAGMNSATISNPIVSPAQTTTYSVTVTDANFCTEVTTATVNILTRPEALFELQLAPTCSGVTVDFTNNSIDGDSFQWMIGGETTTEIDPQSEFAYNELIAAELIATNTSGCTDTIAVSDMVNSIDAYFDFTIPNVITPNGDGFNDMFTTSFSSILGDCIEVEIFNRWGQQVYAGAGSNSDWNGQTDSGQDVPAGAYFYVFTVQDLPPFTGTVNVIR